MANIQSSPYPLVFPVAAAGATDARTAAGRVEVRTLARALEGMQKEALVTCTPGGRTWRMVCDEGPYLNGTDLAPFPLAFFTTGLVNSYLEEILALAASQNVRVRALELIQDNLYTMEGSAVRGDMIGSALPVALHVSIDAEGSEPVVRDLVTSAVLRSPADALLRGTLESEFAITSNGKAISTGKVRPWMTPPASDLSDAMFEAARPDPDGGFPADIITKLGSAEAVFDVEGGAGSSLKSEQKRTLHVRGIANLRDDGVSETRVQLFKPIGSNFRFLCDPRSTAGAVAPAPLAYLSAGIAFCYLTQIGRYVTIMKHDVRRYAIAQHTAFERTTAPGTPPSAEPVRTYVEIDSTLDDKVARGIVDMGERTCFLHAAARTPLKTKLHIAPNTPAS